MKGPTGMTSVNYQYNCVPQHFFAGHKRPQSSYGFRPSANTFAIPAGHTGIQFLLTPIILGGLGLFSTGFLFYGRPCKKGYSKYIFFLNILALIATFGAGAYTYQVFRAHRAVERFKNIIWPVAMIIFFYGAAYNLTYSLYPHTFAGTIGKTPITQFLSFLALSTGTIAVGETFSVEFQETGVQVLAGIEALFQLYVLTLIITLVL